MKRIAIILLTLLIFGCVSYPNLPIHKGMTRDEVRANFGPTYCIYTSTIGDYHTEIWTYTKQYGELMWDAPPCSGVYKIIFKDDVVYGWENF
ncbi:MAG: hypothetical protein ABSA71_17325 [Desulfomonilia bacterium]|jgi:hypothetical protein